MLLNIQYKNFSSTLAFKSLLTNRNFSFQLAFKSQIFKSLCFSKPLDWQREKLFFACTPVPLDAVAQKGSCLNGEFFCWAGYTFVPVYFYSHGETP
jgi:hypothetical protein